MAWIHPYLGGGGGGEVGGGGGTETQVASVITYMMEKNVGRPTKQKDTVDFEEKFTPGQSKHRTEDALSLIRSQRQTAEERGLRPPCPPPPPPLCNTATGHTYSRPIL